ncbi:MAG: AI-2E family transporter [Gammaproteobacteria bacterium]
MYDYLKNFFTKYFYEEEQYAALLLIIIASILFYFIGAAITPILISILLSYLLNGLMISFTSKGLQKNLSFYLTFLIFISIYVLIFLTLPLITGQIGSLLNELPAIVSYLETLFRELVNSYPDFFTPEQIDEIFSNSTSFIPSIAEQFLLQLNSGFSAAMNALINVILIPILVFFFLKDKKEMLSYVTFFLPKKKILLSKIWIDLDVQLFGYVKGKALEMIIIGFVTSTVFWLLGVNYSLILGILVGLSVLIPLFGAILVTIPVLSIGLFQWGLDTSFLIFTFSYFVIQILDGNVLFPILMGNEVNLHPVIIILAILVFGGIWGFWGLLLAVPLATLIRAVYKVWPKKEAVT